MHLGVFFGVKEKEASTPPNLTLSTSVATRQCPSELALLSLLHQFPYMGGLT